MKRRSFFTRLAVLLMGLLLLSCSSLASAAAVSPSQVGQITLYHLPHGYYQPTSIITGPDGNLWFENHTVSTIYQGMDYLGRITPSGQITEYPEKEPPCGGDFGYYPQTLIVGPDGDLWTMGCFRLTLLRINPRTLQMTLFTFGNFSYSGEGLTVGSDGNLWLLESIGNNSIDRFSLKDHSLTVFPIPTQTGEAHSLTSGADGNLWFTESLAQKIGRLNPRTGKITEYPLPPQWGESPGMIVAGPKGDPHLWFLVDQGFLDSIDPVTGRIMQVQLPDGNAGPALSTGPDGNLWFFDTNQRGVSHIGRATDSAQVLCTDFHVPDPKFGTLFDLTSGPDGNVWFTQFQDNTIGKITTQ